MLYFRRFMLLRVMQNRGDQSADGLQVRRHKIF
jgi:hypothetical protein